MQALQDSELCLQNSKIVDKTTPYFFLPIFSYLQFHSGKQFICENFTSTARLWVVLAKQQNDGHDHSIVFLPVFSPYMNVYGINKFETMELTGQLGSFVVTYLDITAYFYRSCCKYLSSKYRLPPLKLARWAMVILEHDLEPVGKEPIVYHILSTNLVPMASVLHIQVADPPPESTGCKSGIVRLHSRDGHITPIFEYLSKLFSQLKLVSQWASYRLWSD